MSNATVVEEEWMRTQVNLIVAQYVASIAVDWKDLRWLLSKSPAHIVLVSYEELRKAIARKHKGCWVDKETRY